MFLTTVMMALACNALPTEPTVAPTPQGGLEIRYPAGQPKYQNGERVPIQVWDTNEKAYVDLAKLKFSFAPGNWGEVQIEPSTPTEGILVVKDATIDPLRGGTFALSCEYTVKREGGSEDRVSVQLSIEPKDMYIKLEVLSSVLPGQPLDLQQYPVNWDIEPTECYVEVLRGEPWLFVPSTLINSQVNVTAVFSTGQRTNTLVLCPQYYCAGVPETRVKMPDAWVSLKIDEVAAPFRYESRAQGGSRSRVRDNTVEHDEAWSVLVSGNSIALRGERNSKIEVDGAESRSRIWSETGRESFALTNCRGTLEGAAYQLTWEGTLAVDGTRAEGNAGASMERSKLQRVTHYRGGMTLQEVRPGVWSGTYTIDEVKTGDNWNPSPDPSTQPIRFTVK